MQFNRVFFTTTLIFIGCCLPGTLTVRLHHKGRSGTITASKRLIPLSTRSKYLTHGRSSNPDTLFEDISPEDPSANNDESRGFMKKLMLFKSLFYQQKSEPTNNIIIITQPTVTATPTVTTPTATGTAGTTTTTAAASPTGNANDDGGGLVNMGLQTILARDTINDSQAENIVKQILQQNPPNRRRLTKVKKLKRNNLQQQQQQNLRKRRLRKRNQIRKRKPTQQNAINFENLLNNMSLTKRTNIEYAKSSKSNNHPHSSHNHQEDNEDVVDDNNGDEDDGYNDDDEINDVISNVNESNKHNDDNNDNNNDKVNNASGILNLNTNMRLQNIMNAFRKQTPIMYNY